MDNQFMLVDLVELRFRGAKRPRDVVRTETPLRCELTLSEHRPGWHSRQQQPPLLAGVMQPGADVWAIAPLDKAWVRKIWRGNMLIVGQQQSGGSNRVRDIQTHRQLWWLRIVGQPVGTLHSVPNAGTAVRHRDSAVCVD